MRTLLRWAGEDPAREGLLDTPKRVVNAYTEWFRRISRVHHADEPEIWRGRLEHAGFTLERYWHYFSPASMRVLPCGGMISSLRAISDAIALGDEQSIRIFSSQSSVMNRHVGSTSGFTTDRSRRS